MEFLQRWILVLALLGIWESGHSAMRDYEARHAEVSMRMIGHQVLWSVGDSSSVVLPIERHEDTFYIRFGTDFAFHPDIIAPRIDSVINATGIASHYLVEVLSCGTGEVVHSYERGGPNEVLSCGGRAQPKACYDLRISLIDTISTAMTLSEESQNRASNLEDEQKASLPMIALGVSLGFVVLISLIFWPKKGDEVEEPEQVSETERQSIGAFTFDREGMALILKDDRTILTGKEVELLALLADSVNQTLEREHILRTVWGDEGSYVGRTLDVFISKLRKKLEADPAVRIANIRGVGYKLIIQKHA